MMVNASFLSHLNHLCVHRLSHVATTLSFLCIVFSASAISSNDRGEALAISASKPSQVKQMLGDLQTYEGHFSMMPRVNPASKGDIVQGRDDDRRAGDPMCSDGSPCALHANKGGGGEGTVLSIIDFGAVPDGVTDAAPAFLAAFQVACRRPNSTVRVPEGRFRVGPLHIRGPCHGLTFQVNGTMLAVGPPAMWPSPLPRAWLLFEKIGPFQITGSGVLDGEGALWWEAFRADKGIRRPWCVMIQNFESVLVQGVTIRNSPMFHLVLENGSGAVVEGVTVLAPFDSPNTDGIDVSHARNVVVRNCSISVGDDIVAVKNMVSGLEIHHIRGGHGHGISVGSLGKGGVVGCVQDVNVHHVSFHNSTHGLRLKTYDGGVGAIRNIRFADASFSNVRHPVLIDQFYCPHARCPPKRIGVAIYDIYFSSLTGIASHNAPIELDCSLSVPCINVTFSDIDIRGGGMRCKNAYGSSSGFMWPASCLKQAPHPPPHQHQRDCTISRCKWKPMASRPPIGPAWKESIGGVTLSLFCIFAVVYSVYTLF